ncbi:hypothetical protein ACLMJK_003309 [Lecanora helva]
MAESNDQSYNGSCHCGAFQYDVKLPEIKQAVACNCSVCFKKGYLWVFPSADNDLVVENGDGTLKDYEFGRKSMSHKFCPTKQTNSVEAEVRLQIRTLKDINVEDVEVVPYDGEKLEPAFVPPEIDQTAGKYTGSCHCGKVTYALTSKKPLKDLQLTQCNCSICSRNAYLWLYPSPTAISLHGEDHLATYRFGTKRAAHRFCSTCGVSLLNQLDDPDGKFGLQPINLRTLNGVREELERCSVKNVDGKNANLDDEEGMKKAAEFWDWAKKEAAEMS